MVQMVCKVRSVFLLATFGLGANIALAFPQIKNVNPNFLDLDPSFTADYNFDGIVSLSNCSGSLVKFDDSDMNDQALVLTNGHCVKMMNPDEVIINTSSSRSFSTFTPDAKNKGSINATKLVYATMTKTDMGLYQLKQTYQQILDAQGVSALELSRESPSPTDDIQVISGYWRRGYSCQAEAIVNQLKEGKWLFKDSIRYSRPGCAVIGGTSGSPALLAGTRTVIGVNNTINEQGKKCEVNNPCEIDENGTITYEKGIGYAQQTHWIYSCRNEQRQIDLNVEGCLLPKPIGHTTVEGVE